MGKRRDRINVGRCKVTVSLRKPGFGNAFVRKGNSCPSRPGIVISPEPQRAEHGRVSCGRGWSTEQPSVASLPKPAVVPSGPCSFLHGALTLPSAVTCSLKNLPEGSPDPCLWSSGPRMPVSLAACLRTQLARPTASRPS